MGQGESRPHFSPWAAIDTSEPLPEAVCDEIKAIADSADNFLQAAPGYGASFRFPVAEKLFEIEGALKFESHLSKWFPKLVPKRVSEDEFWRNYFSRVHAVLSAHRLLSHSAIDFHVAPPNGDNAGDGTVDTHGRRHPQGGGIAGDGDANTIFATATANDNDGDDDDDDDDGSREQADYSLREEWRQDENEEEERKTGEEKEEDVVRWGIIGCGAVCEIKSGPAFSKVRGSRLVAVMRRTEKLARDFAARHGVAKWYTSVNSLIYDADVDAVYIATPPGSHSELAQQVCAAGKPCYVEKPMARHYEECRLMVEQFRRANVPLFVAFYRRRLPRFLAAKEVVDRMLGDVTSASYTLSRSDYLTRSDDELGWRVQAQHSGGGLFMDVGCHAVDMLDFLVGPLSNVTGDATCLAGGGVETNVAMSFRTRKGALGSCLWDFCSATYEDRLVVRGTKGTLTMSMFGKDDAVLRLPDGKVVSYATGDYPVHVQQPLIHSIVRSLRGLPVTGEEHLPTGLVGARAALVCDTVLRKFYRSRNDAFWMRQKTWAGTTTR